jgi:hypothetical protein
MTSLPRTQRRAQFRAWALDRGLSQHVHEDAYAGTLSGLPVVLDTGIRDSGEYDVIARLAMACGVASVVLKKDTPIEDGHRVLRGVKELLLEKGALRSAFIGEDVVELRFAATTPLERVEHAIDKVIEAWRSPGKEGSAYR